MSGRHLWAVVRKEVQHIFRDRGTFIMVLITPTLVLVLMTYALAVEIKNIPIAVLDHDRSPASRGFIQQITAGRDLAEFHSDYSICLAEKWRQGMVVSCWLPVQQTVSATYK